MNKLVVAATSALVSVSILAIAFIALKTRANTRKKYTLPARVGTYRICVYCGSRPGNQSEYIKAAQSLGEAFVKNNIELVYGGGSIGLMGAIAQAVDNAKGGIVHSIIPSALLNYAGYIIQPENCIVTNGMHERKQIFHDLCDAFVALPGGLGTIEELAETATWAQLGVHNKPFGVLNVSNFYGPLRDLFSKQIDEGFLDEKWADGGLLFRDDVPSLVADLLVLMQENRASKSEISSQEWVI